MNFELRHFDTTLLRFSATEDSNTPEIKILSLDENKKYLLPLDLDCSAEGLAKWLRRRIIPKNRAYAHNFLSKCRLNINRPMNIIKVSKGLSLNDCYWVVEEGFEGTFDKYNLYDNHFSRVLALIAFTGYGSSIIYNKWDVAKVLAQKWKCYSVIQKWNQRSLKYRARALF